MGEWRFDYTNRDACYNQTDDACHQTYSSGLFEHSYFPFGTRWRVDQRASFGRLLAAATSAFYKTATPYPAFGGYDRLQRVRWRIWRQISRSVFSGATTAISRLHLHVCGQPSSAGHCQTPCGEKHTNADVVSLFCGCRYTVKSAERNGGVQMEESW